MSGVRFVVPASAVRPHVDVLVGHVRDFSDGELISAINFGVQRVARALISSRLDYFVSHVDSFILPAQADIIDVGYFTPALLRPIQFVSNNGLYQLLYRQVTPGSTERNAINEHGIIYYDLVSGAIPTATDTIMSVDGSYPTTMFTVNGAFYSQLSTGSRLGIARSGKPSVFGGVSFGADEHHAVVVELLSANVVRITPPSVVNMTPGLQVVKYATVAMRLHGRLQQSVIGRLVYQYLPPRITTLSDMLEPVMGDYVDLIAHYAASMLLRGTRDAGANDIYALAEAMRKELVQESDPRGVGYTQSLGVGVFEES